MKELSPCGGAEPHSGWFPLRLTNALCLHRSRVFTFWACVKVAHNFPPCTWCMHVAIFEIFEFGELETKSKADRFFHSSSSLAVYFRV